MDAAEPFQIIIAQRLKAHRHAIDASVAIAAKAPGFDAAGIGFKRDFSVWLYIPQLADVAEDRGRRLWLHQRRRPATKEDAAHLARANERRRMIQFLLVSRQKPRLIPTAVTDMTVEIAVRALLRAKRPMDVDAKCISRAHDVVSIPSSNNSTSLLALLNLQAWSQLIRR